MNTQMLSKYNISFLKDTKGNKFPDGKTALSSYLYLWRDLDDINDFLIDINQCLNGNYNQIVEPYYNYSLIGIYGTLTSDSLVLSGEAGANGVKIPLIDFNQILLSWKEFLTS